MILYVVEIYNYCHIDEWQTVNIWKTRESAEKAIDQYRQNWDNNSTYFNDMLAYRIIEIDTDVDLDCIYDVVTENGDE